MGGDLGQRHENKIPTVHPGMGNDKTGGLDDRLSRKKNVDIDDSGAAIFSRNPFHGFFNGLNPIQKLQGFERGIDFENLIEKPGLISKIDRFGSINRGSSEDLDAVFRQHSGCRRQVLPLPAEVAAH